METYYGSHPARKYRGDLELSFLLRLFPAIAGKFLRKVRSVFQKNRPDFVKEMLAEGCVFRHGKSTISRRDDDVFFLWRKAGAPCLKRGLFARIPRFFQVFILFGGINFRLFLRRNIALRSAVISRSCQES